MSETDYVTRRVDCGGHTVIVHTPIRTEAEKAAYLAGIDRAIRRAFAGWKLRRVETAAEDDLKEG